MRGYASSKIGYFVGGDVQFTNSLQLPGLVPTTGDGPPGPFAVLSLNIPAGFRLGVFPPLDAETPKATSTPRFDSFGASSPDDSQQDTSQHGSAVGTPSVEPQPVFISAADMPDLPVRSAPSQRVPAPAVPVELQTALALSANNSPAMKHGFEDRPVDAPVSEPIPEPVSKTATELVQPRPAEPPASDPIGSRASTDRRLDAPAQIAPQTPSWADYESQTPMSATFPGVQLRERSDMPLRDPTYSIYEAYYRQSICGPADIPMGTGATVVDTLDPLTEAPGDLSEFSVVADTTGDTTEDSFNTAADDPAELLGTARISRELLSAMDPAMNSSPAKKANFPMSSSPAKSANMSLHSSPAKSSNLAMHPSPAMNSDMAMHSSPAMSSNLTMHSSPAMSSNLAMHPSPAMSSNLAIHSSPDRSASRQLHGEKQLHTPASQTRSLPGHRPETPPSAPFDSPRRRVIPTSPLRGSVADSSFSGLSGAKAHTPDLASRVMTPPSRPSFGSAPSIRTSTYSDTTSPGSVQEYGSGLSSEALLFQQWTELLTSFSSRSTSRARKLVPQGVPRVLRGRVWLLLAQDRMKRVEGVFPQLRSRVEPLIANPGSSPYSNLIEQDLARSFPPDRPFKGADGATHHDLRIVLYAFALHCPSIGYTEGICLIAGLLLMHMPVEDAFWMLDTVINHYGISAYYSNGTQQMRIDSMVVDELLRLYAPEAHARLHALQIGPLVFMSPWILPVFVRTLPWPTLLRVWDAFLCHGHVYLLRTVLAIVRITYSAFPRQGDSGETLQCLIHPPSPLLTPSALLPLASDPSIKDSEIKKMIQNAARHAGVDSASMHSRASSWKLLHLFRHK
ncbi:hypothetical protein MCUN1_003315 [Malassezia cuniculi]|uniref:Rab-GAP TBC domain-containing protein n=1 Tax=Malassezia cuniculi TaxID=948313 RepID=A0AAF0JD03_9BASI|nr:hypothetical protein MCUN1_003315 [Malassezia cuniculi]